MLVTGARSRLASSTRQRRFVFFLFELLERRFVRTKGMEPPDACPLQNLFMTCGVIVKMHSGQHSFGVWQQMTQHDRTWPFLLEVRLHVDEVRRDDFNFKVEPKRAPEKFGPHDTCRTSASPSSFFIHFFFAVTSSTPSHRRYGRDCPPVIRTIC